ncbi:MAG TPA: TetR family transcriptional regulator [Actinomycetes bacterium]
MASGGRGRRPAGSGTREAIAAAARRQFGEVGYQRASLRSIAAEAGVDPRLVLHFFGSKQELFASVVELPFDPETTFDTLMAAGEQGLGRRVAEFLFGILDSPEGRKTVTGLIRAAASEEEAAATIRDLVAQRLLLPLASRVGRDRPELRASLVASQIVGLAMARHVVGLTPLATASRDELVAALAPVFDHYLTGPLT